MEKDDKDRSERNAARRQALHRSSAIPAGPRPSVPSAVLQYTNGHLIIAINNDQASPPRHPLSSASEDEREPSSLTEVQPHILPQTHERRSFSMMHDLN